MNPHALKAADELVDITWPIENPSPEVIEKKRTMANYFAEIINAAMVEAILDELNARKPKVDG